MSSKRCANYVKTLLLGFTMPAINSPAKSKENKNIEWMTNLPDNVRSLPISRLTIPGSHNSFTYSLVRGGKAGPDQPKCIQKMAAMFPSIASRILIRWGICQHKTATFQLENGIRYFDIRLVAVGEPENDPKLEKFEGRSEKEREHRILHCLLGSEIKPILSEIKLFLSSHLEEVVILDLQHLYDFQPEDHTFLIKTLLDMFEGELCPWQVDMDAITLNTMRRAGHQLIVIYPALYRSQESRDQLLGALGDVEGLKYPPSDLFWPRNLCPTPWPNTTSGNKMEQFLDNKLSKITLSLDFIISY